MMRIKIYNVWIPEGEVDEQNGGDGDPDGIAQAYAAQILFNTMLQTFSPPKKLNGLVLRIRDPVPF